MMVDLWQQLQGFIERGGLVLAERADGKQSETMERVA